jgi:hypothetical protein
MYHKLSPIGIANSVYILIQNQQSSLRSAKRQVFPAVLLSFSQFLGYLTSSTTISPATAPLGRTANMQKVNN